MESQTQKIQEERESPTQDPGVLQPQKWAANVKWADIKTADKDTRMQWMNLHAPQHKQCHGYYNHGDDYTIINEINQNGKQFEAILRFDDL